MVGKNGQTDGTQGLLVRAPAKLNLSLAVLDRRPDGFHEIESLMVPVSLHDRLRVRVQPAGQFSLAVRFKGRLAHGVGRQLARDVPTDDSNLVIRAARLLATRAGVTAGLAIDLEKEIPSGAGLAGGSSDAAATLMALSGKTHRLISAVVVAEAGRRVWHHVDVASLTARKLSSQFIADYLDSTGDAVFSSVGAYQLEGFGAQLFERVEGDYFTVLGMPLLPLLGYLRIREVLPS